MGSEQAIDARPELRDPEEPPAMQAARRYSPPD